MITLLINIPYVLKIDKYQYHFRTTFVCQSFPDERNWENKLNESYYHTQNIFLGKKSINIECSSK